MAAVMMGTNGMTHKSWLPPHVTAAPDRHGKIRYRYRKGRVQGYLPGQPGEVKWLARLAELQAIETAPITIASPTRPKPKSMDALFISYKKTPRWRRKQPKTQRDSASIIERFLNRKSTGGQRLGEKSACTTTAPALNRIFASMHEKPAAANNLRDQLIALFNHAVYLGWRADNPARLTDSYLKGDGHHTWTDAEIQQYRTAHPLGTMARLVMEATLNSAARRCNVADIEWDHMRGGRIIVPHVKGGYETNVLILPDLQAAINAMPARHIRYLLHTQYGEKFTANGLGMRMKKWTFEAGIPHCTLHGLRKARARQLAESDATDAQGMATLGQTKNETFAFYRAKANRTALADAASAKLAAHLSNLTAKDLSNP
jgi:integrase